MLNIKAYACRAAQYQQFAFTYNYDGKIWHINICAKSVQEAEERIRTLSASGEYSGVSGAVIPGPVAKTALILATFIKFFACRLTKTRKDKRR